MSARTAPIKICLSAPLSPSSRGLSFLRALAGRGHRVTVVNEAEFFPRKLSPAGRTLNRLTRRRRRKSYNRSILENLRDRRHDLLLVLKGVHLRARTLAEAGKILPNLKIFNINYDDFFSASTGNLIAELSQSLRYYDCLFTTRRRNLEELKSLGAGRVFYLPFSYDPALHFPVTPSLSDRRRLESAVIFVGTYEKERAAILESAGLRGLAVWGNLWRGKPLGRRLKNACRNRELLGLDYPLALNSSRVALNFFRRGNRDTLNSRSFELPACGAFVLSERSPDLAEHFEEGREVACFESPEELREKAGYYLKNERERTAVARAGYERVRREHNTIADRVDFVLNKYHETR